QYDITDKEMSLEEAKKLLYNWDYNLTKAVEKLSELYKSAAKLKEDVSNWETYCRPWDTMFALYYDQEGEYNFIEDLAGNELASSIDTRFSFYATKPFNTGSGYNKEVYKYIVELTKEDMLVIGEGKEAE